MRQGLIIAVLFLALLAASVFVVEQIRIPDMIEVEGKGEIEVQPDTAHLQLGVVALSNSASEAAGTVSDTMNNVLASLKSNGVSDDDVRTVRLATGPVSPAETGDKEGKQSFQAEQSVIVTIRDLGRVPAFVNAASAAGANTWHVEYYVADQTRAEGDARQAALNNAISAADAYAHRGGFTRGRILKLAERNVEFPTPDFEARTYRLPIAANQVMVTAQRMSGPNFTIPKPAPLKVDSSVSVLFELR